MSMQIVDDRIAGVSYRAARVQDPAKRLLPDLIVLHDTDGAITRHSSVEWFEDAACRTSAHVVVERDGSITQMVDFDVKAAHAGESCWRGRKYCNGFAIGIELVNPGRLRRVGNLALAEWHRPGQGFDIARYGIVEETTVVHGRGLWMPYTAAQLAAVIDLCSALVEAYPSIREIATHYEISPGRKTDCCPLLPLPLIRERVLGDLRQPDCGPLAPEQSAAPDRIALGDSGVAVEQAQQRLAALGLSLIHI